MRTLDDYILKQTLRPLGLALIIALLLLLLERMLRLLDTVLGSQGSFDVVLKLLTFLVPHYLGLAIPAALFLALFIAFSRMQRDSELDALMSAGYGLHQQLRPALVITFGLTLVGLVMFGYLQPLARYTYRAVLHDLQQGPVNRYLQEGLFIQLKDTTYMVEALDRDRSRFSKVFAYRNEEGGSNSVVTARLAVLEEPERPGDPARLNLYDGVRMDLGVPSEAAALGKPDETPDKTPDETPEQTPEEEDAGPESSPAALPVVVGFDRTTAPVELERRTPFRRRGIDERELTLNELWRERDQPPLGLTTRVLMGEFHSRIVRVLSTLLLPLLAISLSLGPRRTQRVSGIVLGLAVLIAYNKVLAVGAQLASFSGFSPWLTLWLPFLVFIGLTGALFMRAAFSVNEGGPFSELWNQAWRLLSRLITLPQRRSREA